MEGSTYITKMSVMSDRNPDVISQNLKPPEIQQYHHYKSEDKVAQNASRGFKDIDSKFSRRLGECWAKYVSAYNRCQSNAE